MLSGHEPELDWKPHIRQSRLEDVLLTPSISYTEAAETTGVVGQAQIRSHSTDKICLWSQKKDSIDTGLYVPIIGKCTVILQSQCGFQCILDFFFRHRRIEESYNLRHLRHSPVIHPEL